AAVHGQDPHPDANGRASRRPHAGRARRSGSRGARVAQPLRGPAGSLHRHRRQRDERPGAHAARRRRGRHRLGAQPEPPDVRADEAGRHDLPRPDRRAARRGHRPRRPHRGRPRHQHRVPERPGLRPAADQVRRAARAGHAGAVRRRGGRHARQEHDQRHDLLRPAQVRGRPELRDRRDRPAARRRQPQRRGQGLRRRGVRVRPQLPQPVPQGRGHHQRRGGPPRLLQRDRRHRGVLPHVRPPRAGRRADHRQRPRR
ncbi:MAG: UDP-N-acetylmuramate--L-alanine ligase, partial [uncultured Phycisphaerae bacterium]